jgi:uncharacterized glyoxalase superfamily protein PhnB
MLSPAEPSLFASDIEQTLEYFTDKLGFEIVFTYGEPMFYAQVGRDKARINVRQVHGDAFVEGIRERDELLTASIPAGNAADLRALYEEFEKAGVDFFRPLKQEKWGARTFIVRDRDGNLLLFAGTAA